MSDHLDGQSVRNDPRLDISDVYILSGATANSIVLIMNINPLSGSGGFHPECFYMLNVDINADGKPDLALQATFGNPDAAGIQPVTLRMNLGKSASDPSAKGSIVASGHTGSTINGTAGLKLYAGPAGDPFYIAGDCVTAVRTAGPGGEGLGPEYVQPRRGNQPIPGH